MGALWVDRKAGLRIDVVGLRATSRSTEAEAISRASLWGCRSGLRCCRLGSVPFQLWWRLRYASFRPNRLLLLLLLLAV
jgi:hypothetical protein